MSTYAQMNRQEKISLICRRLIRLTEKGKIAWTETTDGWTLGPSPRFSWRVEVRDDGSLRLHGESGWEAHRSRTGDTESLLRAVKEARDRQSELLVNAVVEDIEEIFRVNVGSS